MTTGNVVGGFPVNAQDVVDELDAAGLDQLSATATVANTTTETAVAVLPIGAGTAAAGSIYRIKAMGLASVTGTPTVTFRARIGGVAGTVVAATSAITASSGISNHTWEAELHLTVLTTGAGGTCRALMTVREAISVAGAAPYTVINRQDGLGSISINTTISRDLVITMQWSAASASNTATCYIAACEQVA